MLRTYVDMNLVSGKQPHAWDLGEFYLIDRIRALVPDIDLTDDCAQIELPYEGTLLFTTDAAIRGVHFPEDSKYIADGGFRAVAGAVSDINASAGKPLAALLALVIPPELTLSEFDRFLSGLLEYSRHSEVPLVGGNISRGDRFGATISVIGSSNKVVTRSGARPDDLVVLSGSIGGSEIGRMIISGEASDADIKSLDSEIIGTLLYRHLRPLPPLGLGEKLAAIGATSMVDISDGLIADVEHIAEASGVNIHIELGKLPLYPGVTEIAQRHRIEPAILAAESGEEFELIATMSLKDAEELEKLQMPMTVIGRVRSGNGFVDVTLNGEPIPPGFSEGWKHF